MRKFVVLGILLLAAFGGSVFGYRWWTVGRFFETTDDAYVRSDISIISPKVEGYVSDIRVVENQLVKAGDVLVAIDPRDYQARAAQAEATAAAEKATIQTIDSRLTLQQ